MAEPAKDGGGGFTGAAGSGLSACGSEKSGGAATLRSSSSCTSWAGRATVMSTTLSPLKASSTASVTCSASRKSLCRPSMMTPALQSGSSTRRRSKWAASDMLGTFPSLILLTMLLAAQSEWRNPSCSAAQVKISSMEVITLRLSSLERRRARVLMPDFGGPAMIAFTLFPSGTRYGYGEPSMTSSSFSCAAAFKASRAVPSAVGSPSVTPWVFWRLNFAAASASFSALTSKTLLATAFQMPSPGCRTGISQKPVSKPSKSAKARSSSRYFWSKSKL
mmetsp:Transcript_60554/g.109113  ORF Transcript_60554/g.109113 Transcript_60554/m.109113 type:complete len:277 (+) Transcript_60554:1529-2359(+)